MAAIVNIRDIALQSVSPRYARTSTTLERTGAPWTNLAQNTFDPSVVAITKTAVPAVYTPAGSSSISFVPTGAGSHYIAAATTVALSSSSTPFKVGAYLKRLSGSYKVVLRTTTKTSGTPNNTLQRGVNSSLVQDTSIASTGSGYSAITFNVQTLSDGWARLSITGTYTKQASENEIDFSIYILDASGTESYTGDGSSGFYVYGPTLFLNEQPDDTIGDLWIDSTTKFTSPWNGHAWMTPEAALPTKQGVVYLYRRSATTLTDSDKPASNVYSFITQSFTATPTNSWTSTIPAANGNPVYVIACTPVDDDGDNLATVPTADWSTPVILTQDGAKSAVVLLYQRTNSSTAPSPATPTASITYTFADGSISPTSPGNSWSTNIPAASNGVYLWTIKAVALNNGATDTIATGEWSAPAILSQDGTSGEGISCTANSLVTAISETNVYTPSSITLSVLRGTPIAGGSPSNGSYVWTVIGGTFTGSTTTVNSGTGAMTAFSPSTAMTTDQVQFQCVYTHNEPGSPYHNKTYTDRITITKLREAAGINGVLTNESHTVPATTAGVVSSYSGATGTFKVYYGIADVTTSCVFSYISNTGFSSAPTGTINISTGVYTISSGIDSASPVATVTYRATYTHPVKGAVSVDKVFTITKATTGTNGATGSTGAQAVIAYATRFGTAMPSPPSITAGQVPTAGNAPTGTDSGSTWYTSPPTGAMSANYWLFQVNGTYNGSTYTWTNPSYLSTFKVGQLSALSADIGSITAGTITGITINGTTITGGTVQTASSGKRIVLSGANNTIEGYNSTGTKTYEVDTNFGNFYLTGNGGIYAVMRVENPTGSTPAIRGYQGNGAIGGIGVEGQSNGSGPGIKGIGNSGPGVEGTSTTGPGGKFKSVHTVGLDTNGAGIRIKTADSTAGYAVMLRNDSTAFYMLKTANNDADGSWTTARPFTYTFSTDTVNIEKLSLGGMTIGTGSAAAKNSAGGDALVSKPGSASNNTWLTLVINGTTYYIPVWT